MEPTKMLLLPAEVTPHPNDPVELRRLMFQTPGLQWKTSPATSLSTYLITDSNQCKLQRKRLNGCQTLAISPRLNDSLVRMTNRRITSCSERSIRFVVVWGPG